ncbi:hypothetical protein K0M31_003452 [Melipona bicolor]|uniref:F-box domain-containing protein n=1 Tax=Melipona bicolor TaxID=60889 RepID=A0AA40KPI2_9HYME|nr:hypothetical protein K0M31_003452 [Melipona bicolor]
MSSPASRTIRPADVEGNILGRAISQSVAFHCISSEKFKRALWVSMAVTEAVNEEVQVTASALLFGEAPTWFLTATVSIGDNNVCRSTSSSTVISVPVKQQILLQQKCIYVTDLCQLDGTLLLKIFSWPSTRNLCSVAQTCRCIWEIAWHPSLWKEVEIRYPQNATAALNALTRRCHTYIRRLIFESAVGLAGIFAQLPF